MTIAPTPMDPRRRARETRAVEDLLASFRRRMFVLVDSGVDVSALGAADTVASELVAKLPAANPWGAIVGPCYTSGALQRELGIGRQAVSKAVAELRLLRLVTSDGVTVYPAFQVRDGAVVPGLGDILRTLRKGADSPWMWAQWLNTPVARQTSRDLERRIDNLAAGDIEGVLIQAEHTAAAWAA